MEEKNSTLVPAAVQTFISACALRYPGIQRISLFGSRARGDAKERSDFDFAVLAPELSRSQWSRFALEIEENLPTLCGIDVLRLDETVTPELRLKIEQEGVVLYERAA